MGSDTLTENLQDLILVAGHALFRKEITSVPEHPERDEAWVLQPFQKGEPPLYIEHIRQGASLLAGNSAALLISSGCRTRLEAGEWSEASTYIAIGRHYHWWVPENAAGLQPDMERRVAAENYARDSFENLLFGVCRFQQLTGRYPRNVTVISWAFKRERFQLHRATIRFPAGRFHFEGFNAPLGLEQALQGERITLESFREDRYGTNPEKLGRKRVDRNPFGQQHNYRTCPGMAGFFDYMERPESRRKEFGELLPWEG